MGLYISKGVLTEKRPIMPENKKSRKTAKTNSVSMYYEKLLKIEKTVHRLNLEIDLQSSFGLHVT